MNKKNLVIATVCFLFVIAAFLRLWNLEGFITFLGDQGRDASIIRRIITFEHFPAIGAPSSIGGVYLGPFYYYFMAPWLLLAGYHPVGLGYGVAIISLIGLAIITNIVKKKVDSATLLLFLNLCVFSAILIDLSRFSWNPNLLPVFGFLTLTFLYFWIKKQYLYYAVLFGSFIAFCIQLHYLALILCIPAGIFIAYHLLHEKKPAPPFSQIATSIGFFFFFSLPLLLFDLRHDFLNIRNFFQLFAQGKISTGGSYIDRLGETSTFFFSYVLGLDLSRWQGYIILMTMIILSYCIWRKSASSFFILHASAYIMYIVSFAVLNAPRHYHYFGPVYISFYFVLASAVTLIKKTSVRIAITCIGAGIFIFINAKKYSFLYYPPNNQITFARQTADVIKRRVKAQPVQIVALPPTETDGHFRYFLELQNIDLLPHDSPEQAQELYVICFDPDCKPVDDPHWQIAAFYDKKIDTSFPFSGGIIYKVIHRK